MCICGRQLVGGQVGLLTPCSLPVNCHCRTSDTGNTPWLPLHAQIKECDGILVQMEDMLGRFQVRRCICCFVARYILPSSAGLSAMLLGAFPLRRFFCDLFW